MYKSIKVKNKELLEKYCDGDKGYAAVFVVFAVMLLANIIKLVIDTAPSFDGGLNLQVSYNLLVKGAYSTMYNGGTMFDPIIQTGAPVIIPVFILFKIFGVGMIQSLAVNGIYMVGTFWLTFVILRRAKVDKWLNLICCGIIFLVPGFTTYGMGVLGEIPTLFWILFTVYMFLQYESKGKDVWLLCSGICFGIGFLTKTVILIVLPSIIVVMLSKCLLEKQAKLAKCPIWVGGFLIPTAIFEVYKLSQLGWKEYKSSLSYLVGEVSKQAGVSSASTYQDTEGIFNKFFVHLSIFSDLFHISVILIVVLLLINFLCLVYRFVKERKLSYIQIIDLVAFSYFGWWLVITSTEKAWSRRIIIGVILMLLVTIINANHLWKKLANRKVLEKTIALLACLGIIISLGNRFANINHDGKDGVNHAVDFVRDYVEENPETIVCGSGWWQNPVIQVFSEIGFKNIVHLEKEDMQGKDVLFVADQYMNSLADAKSLLGLYEYEPIYTDKENQIDIYKITDIYPYVPFTEDDFKNAEKLDKNGLYYKDDAYQITRGIYSYEETSDLRWTSENFAVLLTGDSNTKELRFKYMVQDIENMLEGDFELTVTINGKECFSRKITDDGEYEEVITIDDSMKNNDIYEIHVATNNHLDTSKTDTRELSYGFLDLELR